MSNKSKKIYISEGAFLLAAFLSFIFSVSLWFLGSKDEGVFVGIWVPSIIALGVFFQNIKSRLERN
ncbi:MAG: hypothetical protein ACO3LE_09030 [Bdellovibrionota bacterium]